MKIIRNVLLAVTLFSFSLTIFVIFLSSAMQGYWKGKLGDNPEMTAYYLQKKSYWARFGETKVFGIITLILLCILVAFILFAVLRGRKEK
jgi:ABC-type Fe3+ transport system permease subunit